VGDNQVWVETLSLRVFRTAKGSFTANNLGLKIADPWVNAFAVAAVQ
jgi:hypothetical protein